MEITTIEVPSNLHESIVKLINNEATRQGMRYIGIEKNALIGEQKKKIGRRSLFCFAKKAEKIDREKYLCYKICELHIKRGQDII